MGEGARKELRAWSSCPPGRHTEDHRYRPSPTHISLSGGWGGTPFYRHETQAPESSVTRHSYTSQDKDGPGWPFGELTEIWEVFNLVLSVKFSRNLAKQIFSLLQVSDKKMYLQSFKIILVLLTQTVILFKDFFVACYNCALGVQFRHVLWQQKPLWVSQQMQTRPHHGH